MTEETLKEIEEANAEAAASELPEAAPEGNDSTVGGTPDAPAEPASIVSGEISLEGAGAVGLGDPVVNEEEVVPTTGGSVPTEPLLLATVSVFRSRYDGQFFIQANTGEGYSAPNASTAGHVASNLVATIVQESINSKFEYAAGAA